jgi:hypothetical protein
MAPLSIRMWTGAWLRVPWNERGFLVNPSLRLLISRVVPTELVLSSSLAWGSLERVGVTGLVG